MKADWPGLSNLRLDPFERASSFADSTMYMQWYGFQFWRFVFVQDAVAKLAKSAIEFPPMQAGASFNLDAVKEKLQKAQSRQGQ